MVERPRSAPRRMRSWDVLFGRSPLLPKPVVWIASTKDDISALPDPVKASFGHQLREVQQGATPRDTKPLPQFGAGVFELRAAETRRGAHRIAPQASGNLGCGGLT